MYKMMENPNTVQRVVNETTSVYFRLDANSPEVTAYKEWLSAGNVPEPAPQRPPLQIAKSLVLSRLTDDQLDAALNLMTNRQKERWRSPDHAAVDIDDPELLAVLGAVGADAKTVLDVSTSNARAALLAASQVTTDANVNPNETTP